MNEIIGKRNNFIFLLTALVLILSACNPVGIESEPVMIQIEPTARAPEIVQPKPTVSVEEVSTPTTTIIVPTVTPINSLEENVPEATGTATAELPSQLDYSNQETGISFSYPSNWTLDEEANVFIFHNGSIMLRISYRRVGEQVRLWTRTGIPAGDVIVLEGSAPFLGQALSRNGLIYEDRLKAVFYGGHPVSIVESEVMEFNITLDDQGADYLAVNLTDDVVADVEAILASFSVTSTQDEPSGELQTYSNPEYGGKPGTFITSNGLEFAPRLDDFTRTIMELSSCPKRCKPKPTRS